MSERNWRRIAFALVMIAALALGGVVQAGEPSYTAEWDGRGTDSERCDLVGEGERTEEGWIHWVFGTKGQSTDATLTLGGTGEGTYHPDQPLNANVWHFYTPYFDLDGLTATIELDGKPGPGGGLVISDYCPGLVEEELTVIKTVETSFVREHKWDIDKRVDTDKGHLLCTTHALVHLYPDGSGDELVKWIIDVTYKGYEDSALEVSGVITTTNTGQVGAVITDVEDVLAGMPIAVDCPVEFPYTLAVGETLVCTYSVDVESKIEGYNVVTVKTEKDMYMAQAAIVWGEPTMELYKTINVKDESFLHFGLSLGVAERTWGPVTAPNNAQFIYETYVTYEEFGALCDLPDPPENEHWWWHNRAWIVETGQEVIKYLVIHILCPLD
jgi:hypothetical protein